MTALRFQTGAGRQTTPGTRSRVDDDDGDCGDDDDDDFLRHHHQIIIR